MIRDLYAPGLTVDAATAEWQAIREEQQAHRRVCTTCTPDMAVCAAGQGLSELERRAYSLVRRARDWEEAAMPDANAQPRGPRGRFLPMPADQRPPAPMRTPRTRLTRADRLKPCPWCGREYVAYDRDQKYCDTACSTQATADLRRDRKLVRHERDQIGGVHA